MAYYYRVVYPQPVISLPGKPSIHRGPLPPIRVDNPAFRYDGRPRYYDLPAHPLHGFVEMPAQTAASPATTPTPAPATGPAPTSSGFDFESLKKTLTDNPLLLVGGVALAFYFFGGKRR